MKYVFFIIQSDSGVEIPSQRCLSIRIRSWRQSSHPWRCVDLASSCFPMLPLWQTTETVPWRPLSQPPPSYIPQQSLTGTNLRRGVTITEHQCDNPLPPTPCEKFSHEFKAKKTLNTKVLINCTSVVNQNEFSQWLFNFCVLHTPNVSPLWGLLRYRFSNHQSKHSLFQSHSTSAANLEGNERTTFSFCWAQDFPTFLKKETASRDNGEVMTVNLLQSKLSLLESAPAVSFEWISSCVVHLDCPRLALVACGDWCDVRESRAEHLSSIDLQMAIM